MSEPPSFTLEHARKLGHEFEIEECKDDYEIWTCIYCEGHYEVTRSGNYAFHVSLTRKCCGPKEGKTLVEVFAEEDRKRGVL